MHRPVEWQTKYILKQTQGETLALTWHFNCHANKCSQHKMHFDIACIKKWCKNRTILYQSDAVWGLQSRPQLKRGTNGPEVKQTKKCPVWDVPEHFDPLDEKPLPPIHTFASPSLDWQWSIHVQSRNLDCFGYDYFGKLFYFISMVDEQLSGSLVSLEVERGARMNQSLNTPLLSMAAKERHNVGLHLEHDRNMNSHCLKHES